MTTETWAKDAYSEAAARKAAERHANDHELTLVRFWEGEEGLYYAEFEPHVGTITAGNEGGVPRI